MKQYFLIAAIFSHLLVHNLSVADELEYFPLKDLRLLESPFLHAQDRNLQYLLQLDANALLAPYLREAGLKPKRKSYGNWESSGLDGHIGGHYLSALSLAYASTGDTQIKERLEYFINELERAQQAGKSGYIGGIPGSRALWLEVSEGKIRAGNFSLNNKWVPLYNLHKVYAGLRDAYLIAENKKALKLLTALMTWTQNTFGALTQEQIQDLLISEHGGLNEVFADYYAITGETDFLELAEKFSHHAILKPLLNSEDRLDGLHANTQIPKVVGFARIAQLADKPKWFKASHFFWDAVVNQRSVAIGGNSVSEHFHDKHDFSSMIEGIQGPETCNTYNMLKLSKLLHQQHPSSAYIDYYERALYNHILSSQHPQTGGLVYFTPMRPQHYRVYSQVDTSMWCCVGSGIENHVKYTEFIYSHSDNNLYVNLFIPSRLEWRRKDVIIKQENRIPDNEESLFTIEKGGSFSLNIRHPVWLKSAMTLVLNGKVINAPTHNGFVKISRNWQAGDTLRVKLPMATRVEALPDASHYYAVLHGPVVLAAPVNKQEDPLQYFADSSRMAHVAAGPQCSIYDAPVFVSEDRDIAKKIKRIPTEPLRFAVPDIAHNAEHVEALVPFFRVHESRYMLYWRLTSREGLTALRKERESIEALKIALAEKTVDSVVPGQQQPEVEHNFRGGKTESGVHRGRHWRHAYDWFAYDLKNPNLEARALRLTLNGEDSGRVFDIVVNDINIATIHSDGSAGPVFIERDFPLPEALQRDKTLHIVFRAHEHSMAGGIFEIRLLKGEQANQDIPE